MTQPGFPGGLSELDFVEAYCYAALRKPSAAADSALRALVFADTADRPLLVGLIVQELTEAALRLVAVFEALSDRRYSIARSLMRPLPGVQEWRAFVHYAATFSPEQMLRELSLGEDALPYAESLRGQPNLADYDDLISAAAARNGMLLVPRMQPYPAPTECWFAGVGQDGEQMAASFQATEQDAANLADVTGDLSDIAHGFLRTYLQTRRSAGRRD
jgi:hypothetical protein